MPVRHTPLLEFALSLPQAWEDSPWDESLVAKVGPKIFVFFGDPDAPSVSVKLPESAPHALTMPGAVPTGYGLGRYGWVHVPVDVRDPGILELACEWIEESYRAVAPKRLVRLLDADLGGSEGPLSGR